MIEFPARTLLNVSREDFNQSLIVAIAHLYDALAEIAEKLDNLYEAQMRSI